MTQLKAWTFIGLMAMFLMDEAHAASECHIRGDPHISTFDGHKYTVTGDIGVPCNYYFVKTDNTQIEGQLIACGQREGVYCVDSITIVWGDHSWTLDHGDKIKYINWDIYNERDDDLPHEYLGGKVVFSESGEDIKAEFDSGMKVTWDKKRSVNIEVPDMTTFLTLAGMCGNFDGDAGNDNQDAYTNPDNNKVDSSCPNNGYYGR